MLTNKMTALVLAACLGLSMGSAQCAEMVGASGRDAATGAPAGAPAFDGAAGRSAGVAGAASLRPAAGVAPAPVSPVPEPNPYSLLFIALGILGFSTSGQRNEVFARDP